MRLAFCIFKHFPFGGLQRDLLKMVRECLKRGHGVRIYAIHWLDESGPPAGVELCAAPVRALSNHRLYEKFAAWVRRDLCRRPVDLVVGMNKMPGLDVYYAGDSCYQEKALTQRTFLHRLLPRHRSLLKAERVVFGVGAATEILTIADNQAAVFTRCYGTQPGRFHPLPPGIERDRAAPADKAAVRQRVRRQLGLGEEDRLLLFVGSGFLTKGLDRLLKGLQALPKHVLAETRLYVLGEDKARPFERTAMRLGVGERVHFLGGRADVPNFLFAADGLALPACDENTGTVILEAMISGTPVLVTENCGYANHVRDADAGLVTPSPFEQQVFNAQLAALLTSSKRERWSANGAALAKDETIHQMATAAVDLFERFAVQNQASIGRWSRSGRNGC